MQYHSSRPNPHIVFTILLAILAALSLNACSDTNNVSGPPKPALPGPLTILTNSPLPAGTNQVSYDITLTPSGGTPPYTWSLTPGSPALPTGLELNQSTGTISGTSTVPGTRNTEFMLQDSKGGSVQKVLPITVNPFPTPLAILTPPLPSGIVTRDYAVALSGTGGTTPYTWSFTGSLPAGLSLDPSGVISGQPTVAGTFSPTFQLQDSGNPPATVTKQLSITITEPPPPNITTPSLPPGTFRGSYTHAVSVTGGAAPLVWGVTSGGLPPGLNLNTSNGNISGVPTQYGSFPFTVRVTDQLSRSDDQDFTIVITSPPPPAITAPASLPSGTVNQAYPNTTLTASGGTAPLTWDATVTPALPNGLTWDAATHTISGTPLNGSQGTTSHEFTVRDSTNPVLTATKKYSLTIVSSAPPNITTTSLPNGNVGTVYSQQLQATGGSGNLTWTILVGSLPNGLSMDAAGLISGTPFLPGPPSAFTVQVTDTVQSATQDLSITIDPAQP